MAATATARHTPADAARMVMLGGCRSGDRAPGRVGEEEAG